MCIEYTICEKQTIETKHDLHITVSSPFLSALLKKYKNHSFSRGLPATGMSSVFHTQIPISEDINLVLLSQVVAKWYWMRYCRIGTCLNALQLFQGIVIFRWKKTTTTTRASNTCVLFVVPCLDSNSPLLTHLAWWCWLPGGKCSTTCGIICEWRRVVF